MTILAGPGGNGGGGLVAARHLANRGCQVQVVLSEPDRLTPVPAHQADILARMGVTIASRPSTADLIIDALIGYSLRGDPSAPRPSSSPGRPAKLPRFWPWTHPAAST